VPANVRQTALTAKQKLAGFAKKTKKLNAIFPNLNLDHVSSYHPDTRALQQLFRVYMETYLTMLSKSAPPGKQSSRKRLLDSR
jgi:hypothetical protein